MLQAKQFQITMATGPNDFGGPSIKNRVVLHHDTSDHESALRDGDQDNISDIMTAISEAASLILSQFEMNHTLFIGGAGVG